MKSDTRFPPILQLLIGLAALVMIVWGMQAAAHIINSLFMALVFVIVFAPMMGVLQKRGVPGWLSFILVMLLIVGSIAFLVLLIGVAGSQFIATLPTYAEEFEQQKADLNAWLLSQGFDVADFLLLNVFDPTKIIQAIVGMLSSVGSVLVSVAFMLIVLAFMLVEASGFPFKLQKEYGNRLTFMGNLGRFNYDVRRFLVINTAMGALIGFLDVILFLILGVPFPLLWGVISFLFNYIPTIGFWLALIPPFILAWLALGPTAALIVFLGYWIINGGIQNFVQPKVMGEGVDLSPLVVFVSFLIWTYILGAVGAILAVPLTLFVKDLILDSFEETKGLAYLIGARPEENPPGLVEGKDAG